MKKISIVITTYKRPKFLKRAIDSVLNQTYKNIEVIVADDNDLGSVYRKETEELMKGYRQNVIYVKHNKNSGACIARNNGIKASSGDYYSFLDDDDEFKPNHLENLIKVFETKKNNKIGVVYSQLEIINEKNKVIGSTNSKLDDTNDPLEYHLVEGLNSTSTLLISREALNKVNNWIQIPCGQEDYLLTRIFAAGYKAVSIDERSVKVHFHVEERISTGDKKRKGIDILFDLKKDYLNMIPKNSRKKVYYKHYISKTIVNRNHNIWTSVKSYFEMLKCNSFDKRNISTFIILLLGVNRYNDLKYSVYNYIKKLRD